MVSRTANGLQKHAVFLVVSGVEKKTVCKTKQRESTDSLEESLKN